MNRPRPQFPLFQTPIDLAHAYWQSLLKPGDCVIDATCGNGHDTLLLAKLVLRPGKMGHVIAIDKQQEALKSTQALLQEHLSQDLIKGIAYYCQCHSAFPSIRRGGEIFHFDNDSAPDLQQAQPASKQAMCKHMVDADGCQDGGAGEVKMKNFTASPYKIGQEKATLIVYNLGYLPGGNKNLTTEETTTVRSLEAALPLITPGGVISITCYPGHQAGVIEEQAILHFCASLNPKEWSCCHHRWMNRTNAPSLMLIQSSL